MAIFARSRLLKPKFVNGKFESVPGSERELPADFAFLAMGFTGPEKSVELIDQLEVELDDRGNVAIATVNSKQIKKMSLLLEMPAAVNH